MGWCIEVIVMPLYRRTIFSLPYAGKPEILEGDAAKYYIIGTDMYSKYLVNGLSPHCKMQGI